MSVPRKSLLPAVVITGSSILVGCGSSGSGSNGSCGSTACNTPPPGTGGVFQGTVQGTPAVAIYADNGDMRIGVQNGTYYHLTLSPQTSTVTGSYFGYSTGAAFPNGTDSTTGTASITEGSASLTGTLTDHSGSTDSLSLNDNTVYIDGSALSKLAGTWSYTANGFSVTTTISSDGTFTGTDSNGCALAGSFTQIDQRYDVYGETHVLTCNGVKTNYNGLATYFSPAGTSVAQIELLADDGAGAFLNITFQ
jgi:hypothetical protein